MASISFINTLILLGALLVFAGILSSLIASRFGAPLLLVFLVIGMLAGEDGPGGLSFADYRLTYLVGSLALAVILFDGGLRTRAASFRVALRPAVLLSTLGVVLTAVITGAFAYAVLDLSPAEALLVGSVVASTDAAAVFFLLRTGGLQLSQRVGTTLEIESSANDPVAVFLTLLLVEGLAASGREMGWNVLVILAEQAVVGTALGIAGGLALSTALNRLALPSGLQPLLVVIGAIVVFATAAVAGGSGYLAVYLAGLLVGNRPMRGFVAVTSFHEAATWLCQIVMFLLLGLLVSPYTLFAYALPALAVALGLMLVARPVAVWLCLLPFRFSWREKLFVSWVGLRGAVGIFLASVPMLADLPGAGVYFNVAFFVVLISLLVQGWTINASARLLGVALPSRRHEPRRIELDLPGQLEYELVGYPIAPDSAVLRGAAPPRWARPVLVVRDDRVLTPQEAGGLRAGDHGYFLAPPWRVQLLDGLFAGEEEPGDPFFGEFAFDGGVKLGELAELYDIPLEEELRGRTIADHFAHSISEHPVVGDRLRLGGTALIVREVEDDRVTKAGLRLEPPAPKPHPILDRLARLLGGGAWES